MVSNFLEEDPDSSVIIFCNSRQQSLHIASQLEKKLDIKKLAVDVLNINGSLDKTNKFWLVTIATVAVANFALSSPLMHLMLLLSAMTLTYSILPFLRIGTGTNDSNQMKIKNMHWVQQQDDRYVNVLHLNCRMSCVSFVSTKVANMLMENPTLRWVG